MNTLSDEQQSVVEAWLMKQDDIDVCPNCGHSDNPWWTLLPQVTTRTRPATWNDVNDAFNQPDATWENASITEDVVTIECKKCASQFSYRLSDIIR